MFKWFTTSSDGHPYMPGWHCIMHDSFWGWLTIFLCATIIVGYLIIAYHWYSNLRTLKPGLAKTSLFNMVNIFLFCGICGYLFVPLKMWWPAWKLHAFFLIILNYFTWKYALNTPKLRVVYEEIHNAGELSEKLERQKEITNQLVNVVHDKIGPTIDGLQKDMFFDIRYDVDPSIIEKLSSVRMAILKLEDSLKELKVVANKAKQDATGSS